MPESPTLEELMKKGVHFGHKESKWHPNMEPYIYTSRNGIHIIDLQQTKEMLDKALSFLVESAKQGKTILLVGTKKAIKEIVRKHALEVAAPHVCERWLGGTITNFASIYGLIKNLKELEKQEKSDDYELKYSKKERLDFSNQRDRLIKLIGGIRELTKVPDVIFATDLRNDRTPVREAIIKGIPVVAIADTNTNPVEIDYPIPANDDSIKSVEMITKLVCQAISEGRAQGKPDVKPVQDLDAVQEKTKSDA